MDVSQLQEQDWSSAVPTLSSLEGTTRTTLTALKLPETVPPHNASVPQPPLPTSTLSPSPSGFPMSTFSTNDLANLENMLLWSVQEPHTIILTVMYCVSFILGFIGNLMSLRVLTNRHSRRLAGVSATRNLLVNLAVCDLAVVCVCMPITMGSQIYTAWVYGDFLCRVVPFTQAVSVSASVLTLTVISVNRYYSVKSPLQARSMFTRRRILATVATVWTVSSVICAPIAVMNRRREISIGTFVILVCQEEWPEARLKQGYNVLLFVMLYCLPVTFNLTIGFLTGRRLWGSKKSPFVDLDPRSQALHISRLKTRQKVAKMVVCLVLLFAVSWLPLYLADLWIDCELRLPSWLLQARPFAQWLGLTNSSLNPICYCFIGDLFRSAKVIRTQYYQKVAALFGSASFSRSSAVTSSATVRASSKGATTEGRRISAAAAVVSASIVTIPRFLHLTKSQGLKARDSTESPLGSSHSISDWCRSSPMDWERSLFPCQMKSLTQDFVPARRHSVMENFRSLPLQMASTEVDVLPLRRHSDNRLYSQSTAFKGPIATDCHQRSGQHSSKSSDTFVGEEESPL